MMANVVGFDFNNKIIQDDIALLDVPEALQSGLFCWLDVKAEDIGILTIVLENLQIDIEAIEPNDECEWLNFFEKFLDFTLMETGFDVNQVSKKMVQVVLTGNVLITVDYDGAHFLDRVRQTYREDFIKIAKSPGFLLFELADHLVHGYSKTLRNFSRHNQLLQKKMFGEVEEDLFSDAAVLINHLMSFRKVLLSADEVLDELAIRKSEFVAESARIGLEQKANRIEILCREVLNERDALTSTLNLYLSMIGHRTSKIMHRLTVFSVIFLPLGFLVGLYGMNFNFMPELQWEYGYIYFWLMVISVFLFIYFMGKRGRWWL